MSANRARELWRSREGGETYLVELEGDRVVSAEGPLAEDELTPDSLAVRQAAQGRSPAFTAEAADLERRRDAFVREPLGESAGAEAAPSGGPGLRAVRCWCGELVAANDDDALVAELRSHASEAHPDDVRDEAGIRGHVSTEADDAPQRPPWAY